ncbi:hypothetical protein SUGI_0693850 [Cryptomeria japonica]|nr:hypothetical protein SUGI_0693850 [Cryptomeria japonica]
MDACFFIQIFRDSWKPGDGYRPDDCLWLKIMNAEIFMFENQIPLFLLLKILELKYGTKEEAVNYIAERLASCSPFQTLLPFGVSPTQIIINFLRSKLQAVEEEEQCYRLLHLLNKCIEHFLSPSPTRYTQAGMTSPIMCQNHLKSLQTYNIKFRARNKPVRFEKGWIQSTLFLPKFLRNVTTEPLHKNLINFARLRGQDKLMYDLTFLIKYIVNVNNEHLFIDNGIILGCDTPISETISRLCPGDTSSGGQCRDVINQLDEHCNYPLNQWFHNVHTYFTNHSGKTAFGTLIVALGMLIAVIVKAVGLIHISDAMLYCIFI